MGRRLQRLFAVRLRVQGASMEPGFREGSDVVLSPWHYLFNAPARGDVVAVRRAERLDLKRIVGLPGERVSWNSGTIKINGTALDEPYAMIPPPVPGDGEWRTVHLSRNEYFVAGDHRLYSTDSRRFGPVIRDAIVGKAIAS